MNLWFGPYPADLIRLGAKYTPCMRKHDEVNSRYEKQARLEMKSGCCIDTTTGRCMQTLQEQCLVCIILFTYTSISIRVYFHLVTSRFNLVSNNN